MTTVVLEQAKVAPQCTRSMSSNKQSSYSIQQMSELNIEQAIRLCRESGWNQLREDWRRLIGYEPNGCFAATYDGQLAGTVTTTRYGRELGWIGMMLVHPEFRRRGIATALMEQSINYLRQHGVRCIKLDATPVGQAVYEELGFEVEWTFHRWSREVTMVTSRAEFSDAPPHLSDSALELDCEAFGADRSEFLRLLGSESMVHVLGDSFGMSRPGFLASYLGPVSAETPKSAERIITELSAMAGGSIYWDIPSANTDAIQIARSLGFAPVRDLTRMWLGDVCSRPNLRLQYAIADPGTG